MTNMACCAMLPEGRSRAHDDTLHLLSLSATTALGGHASQVDCQINPRQCLYVFVANFVLTDQTLGTTG